MYELNSPARPARPRRILAAVLCLIVAGLVMLPGCGGSAGTAIDPTAPRPLILQPTEEMTYAFQSEVEQEIGLTVMGQDVQIFQDVTQNVDWRVDSVLTGGGFIGQVTHTRFRLKQEGPGTFEEYDTDDPDAEPQSDMSYGMAGLVGVPLKVRVSPTGDVVVLDGMDAIYNNLADIAGITEAAERDTFRILSADAFTATDMARDLSEMSYLYVDRPVAPGSTWAVSSIAEAVVPIQLAGTARLDSVILDTAFVSLDAQIEAVQDTSAGLFPDQFRNANMSGTTTGTVKIDPQTGIPLRVDLEKAMTGTAEMQTERQVLNVDITISTTSTTEGTITKNPALTP